MRRWLYPGVDPETLYGDQLVRIRNFSSRGLEAIVSRWEKRPFWKKVFAFLDPFDDTEGEYFAAVDLLESRQNPDGKVAKRVRSIFEEEGVVL